MGKPFRAIAYVWAIAYALEACLLWGTCANLQCHRTSLHCHADTYTQKLTSRHLHKKRQCHRTTLHCCVFVLARHIPWTLAPSLNFQLPCQLYTNTRLPLVTCKPASINTQVSKLKHTVLLKPYRATHNRLSLEMPLF